MPATIDFEKRIWSDRPGALVAGLDEAGRGPLAGPVSVGLVVFPATLFASGIPAALQGLSDSKEHKTNERESYAAVIRHLALFTTVVHLPARQVDQLNINGAIQKAMTHALQRAERSALHIDHVWIDGNYRFHELYACFPATRFESIVKGDQKILHVAAASILAKTARDERLRRYDRLFPGYGLAQHKGYGTRAHRSAIQTLGPTPLHRRSFRW
ncbi:MAG: ribonuclease HII [Leptospiraceae bacterium]|nr:ribonuclease HII [Leptospiraceae bacterium]